MFMKKIRVITFLLAACIILSVFQISMASGSLSKPNIDLPAGWVLEEETPYPDDVSIYDPEGGGYLYYMNPDTYAFVIIYYERVMGDHTLDSMRDRANYNFEEYGSYEYESSGMMEVAGEPAGYVKAADYQYDLYQLFIVTVIDDYFMEIFCGYQFGTQDETNVYTLMNSIATPSQAFDFTIIIVLVVVVVIVIVVVFVVLKLLKRKEKTPKPAELRITAEPPSIVADGSTDSTITIQLFDKSGNPISALADTKVQITATKGKLETPIVTIPKGEDKGITRIISTTESGAAQLSAKADNLESMAINLVFVNRRRYCMHCGSIMEPKAKICARCGKSPPAGKDTKECHSCGSVIPVVARFCSECGTAQTGVEIVCRNCGTVLPAGTRFCNNCGASQKT